MQELGWKRQQLVRATTTQLQQATQHVEMLRQKLATLDPKAVLQRGYAVVRQQNRALASGGALPIARSAAQLAVGEELLVQLSQGEVKVKVTEVKE
jgi:exodeoxyribonuclease VII large subunit